MTASLLIIPYRLDGITLSEVEILQLSALCWSNTTDVKSANVLIAGVGSGCSGPVFGDPSKWSVSPRGGRRWMIRLL